MPSTRPMDSGETQPSSVPETHHYKRKQTHSQKKIERHDSRHEQLAENAGTSEYVLDGEEVVASDVVPASDFSHAVQSPSSEHVAEAPQTTDDDTDEEEDTPFGHNFSETVRHQIDSLPREKRKRDERVELTDVAEGRTSEDEENVSPDHLDEGRTTCATPLASDASDDELPANGLESTSSPKIATPESLGCSTAKVPEDSGEDVHRRIYHHSGDEARVSIDSRTNAMVLGAEKQGESKPQARMALWVKWRGKWEPGIRCMAADCPLTTLKTKPNYSKKNHVVVYFPQVRSFSWVDTQQTMPISQDPWPLLYGTLASCRELVKDENLARRRMLLKLGGEMLDISDRLHITAVVERAQNVNVWKTFAREAAAATKYFELGSLLVRLHLAIAPKYVKPAWLDKRHGHWKEDCAKAPSASVVQKLTKELINAVMWEEVAPLWNAPEQPELEPEWKHWKGEAFEEKDSDDDRDTNNSGLPTAPCNLLDNAPDNGTSQKPQTCTASGSKRFKEQARARRQTQLSSGILECSQQKRLKVNKIPSAPPGGPASSSYGPAVTAFRSPLVHPALSLVGQQTPSVEGLPSSRSREVGSGCTLASSAGDLPQHHVDKEPSSNITTLEAHQTELSKDEDVKGFRINEGESAVSVLSGSLASDSGLCSAYLKLKSRRCHRPVKEGITYCGKHKQLANSENIGKDLEKESALAWESGLCSAVLQNDHKRCILLSRDGSPFCDVHAHLVVYRNAHKSAVIAHLPKDEHTDFKGTTLRSLPNEVRCRGITTRGVQCTHKPKDGNSFCVKHANQGTTLQEQGEVKTLLGSSEVPSSKVGRVPKMDSRTGNKTSSEFQVQVGQAINQGATPGALVNGVVSKSTTVSSEVKSVRSDGIPRKRKWLSTLFDKDSVQTVKALASRKRENHHTKVVESKANVGKRCISRTTRNDDQCSFRAKAGSMYCTKHWKVNRVRKKAQEQTAPIPDTKPSISFSGAQDLLEKFLKTTEGISTEDYGSDFHKQLLKSTRAEAANDYSTAVELLKLVTGEMSMLEKILQPKASSGVKKAEKLGLSASGTGTEKQNQSDGSVSSQCGLCDSTFASETDLGRHWKDSHRKEVSLFVRCHACRSCGRLYSRKHTVQRHWKKRHQSIPVASPECSVVCSLCDSQFNHTNDLLGHIVSEHPDQLSNHKLKEFIALGCVVNTGNLEAKLTLQCGDCHEKFNTHWDLFHHKEKTHKTKETEGNDAQVLREERKVQDLDSSSPSLSQSLSCRICGQKFSLLSDLGRHQQAEHSGKIPGVPQVVLSGKRAANSEGCRTKLPIHRKDEEKVAGAEPGLGVSIRRKRNRRFPKRFQKDCHEKDTAVQKEALLFRMKAAVQTAQLRNLRHLQNSEVSVTPTRTELYTLTKGGRMVPYGESESITEGLPDDSELLETAKSVCCGSKFLEALHLINKQLPAHLLARVSQLCSEANVELEWKSDGYLCPSGCRELNRAKSPRSPRPDGIRMSEKTVQELGKCSSNVEHEDSRPNAVVVCDDLSAGQEPVPVVCSVDKDVYDSWKRMRNEGGGSSSETFKSWDSFNYITKRVLDPSLGLDPENYKVGCSCQDGHCSPQTCDHVDIFDNDNVEACDIFGKPMKSRFPYDEQGCIILEEGYLVYECNSSCHCRQNCQNRVLQKGVTVKLEVFRTIDKGWAVRAAQMIPRGTFVCEYVGEVLLDDEANKRGERYDQVGCSYLYDIDAHLDTTGKVGRSKPFVIDATKHGNVARFINHSCAPNLVNYQVLVDSMDCQLAHIGLFASRDIDSGEELAYDYRYRLLPGKGCPCHCGAANCRKRLY